ncbi:hypothetical protein LINGRAHAP2_LOCUS36525 [Linum grandiflorum]
MILLVAIILVSTFRVEGCAYGSFPYVIQEGDTCSSMVGGDKERLNAIPTFSPYGANFDCGKTLLPGILVCLPY